MKVRVVIPTLNNLNLTIQAVTSLIDLEGTGPETELVIVDNGSNDNTVSHFRHEQAEGKAIVLENPEKGHYSRSVNMGANHPGEYDVLVVANNDTIFASGALANLTASLDHRYRIAVPLGPVDSASYGVTPSVLDRPESLQEAFDNIETVDKWWSKARKRFGPDTHIRHPYIREGGYCFAIDRQFWMELGGFDEAYTLFGQDYDLFSRALQRAKIKKCRSAYVEHLEHQTVAWLPERDLEMCRGRFLLTEKREGLAETVSVIIPTFNRTDSMIEAVQSVLRQTYPHYRIYVVDDCSQDWDRIQNMAAQRLRGNENRCWFFRMPANGGPGAARNMGISLARGKYIAFLDSDDVWYPDHLARMVEELEESDAVMCYSPTDFAWRWWDEQSQRYRYRADKHPEGQLSDWSFSPERIQRECMIKTSTVVCWSGLFKGPHSLRFQVAADHRSPTAIAEDWELFKAIGQLGPVRTLSGATGRTHWAKNPRDEAHHSGRLIPWADHTTLPVEWLADLAKDYDPDGPLTVVIPTRGRPMELQRCLESLGSTPAVIVADGRDHLEYVERLAGNRPDTAIVTYDKERGPSFARNRGAEICKTEWVWFLDDDDLASPTWTDAFVANAARADAMTFPLIASGHDGLKVAEGFFTSGLFVRTDVFTRSAGFDESVTVAEERELLGRLESMAARIYRGNVPVAIKTTGSIRLHTLPQPGRLTDRQRSFR